MVNWPPKPSTPREAPWREIEEVADLLKVVSAKLDVLISVQTGAPPPQVIAITEQAPSPAPPIPSLPSPEIVELLRAWVNNKPSFYTNQKDVTTPGIPVQLDDVEVPPGCELTVLAKPTNAGYIYFGTEQTISQSTRRFNGLSAGLAKNFKITNANLIWIDASSAGEGVSYYVERVK
jgi:hypothetical protein